MDFPPFYFARGDALGFSKGCLAWIFQGRLPFNFRRAVALGLSKVVCCPENFQGKLPVESTLDFLSGVVLEGQLLFDLLRAAAREFSKGLGLGFSKGVALWRCSCIFHGAAALGFSKGKCPWIRQGELPVDFPRGVALGFPALGFSKVSCRWIFRPWIF